VALLPPENLRYWCSLAKVCCANQDRGHVKVQCDGCAADSPPRELMDAQLGSHPPVIYSTEERARLVFLIEATPAAPGPTRVGQR